MDRGLRMSGLLNSRFIILIFSCSFLISASANTDNEESDEFELEWKPARTDKELIEEKHAKHDSILEAKILEEGHRFAFTPNYTRDELAKFGRITMRIDFNVTLGKTLDRVFVEIIEIKQENIPFSKFHFNSFYPLPYKHRIVDVPIAERVMKKWIKKPDAEIQFMLKFTFGMLSDVSNVTVKRPILILSSTARPKCGEFACCLTSRVHELEEEEIYHNLIQPRTLRAQRCIDCIRASESDPFSAIVNLNMVIHRKLKAADVPPPVQHGRCRATEWSPVQVIYVVEKGNDTEAVIENVPYVLPTACECIEDADVSEDYIDEQDREDWQIRKRIISEKKKASRTVTPKTN